MTQPLSRTRELAIKVVDPLTRQQLSAVDIPDGLFISGYLRSRISNTQHCLAFTIPILFSSNLLLPWIASFHLFCDSSYRIILMY